MSNRPVSSHDLGVIRGQIVEAWARGYTALEVIVSSRRIQAGEGLRVFGLPVRLNDDLGLNEGALLVSGGRPPISFDFET